MSLILDTLDVCIAYIDVVRKYDANLIRHTKPNEDEA